VSSAASQSKPDRRSARLDVRLSEAERALVEKAAAQHRLAPSAFVRGAALSATLRTDTVSAIDTSSGTARGLTAEQLLVLDAVRIEVKRLGVLLNQEVRLHHRGVIDLGVLASLVTGLACKFDEIVTALGRQEP
jgi:hypothetical protein